MTFCCCIIKWENYLLEYPHPEDFTTSMWKWPPIVYILYRVVAALYLLVWLVLSGILGIHGIYWFIYLSNWTFLMLTLKAVIMAMTAIVGYVNSRTTVSHIGGSCTPAKMPWYLKVQWVFYNIATNASLAVTILYWIILWRSSNTGVFSAINFHLHVYNSIYVIMDLFITATPTRRHHFFHPLLYGLIYIIFTLIYTAAGGTDAAGNKYIYVDIFNSTGTKLLVDILLIVLYLSLLVVLSSTLFELLRLRVFFMKHYCPCGRDYKRHDEADTDIEQCVDTESGKEKVEDVENAILSDGDGEQPNDVFVTNRQENKVFDTTSGKPQCIG